MAAETVWLSVPGYMPPCFPWPPEHTPYLRSASEERNPQKLRSLRPLCFVSLQTGYRSCQFPTVTYFGISLPLGSWGQACCLEAWSAMGWPRNRVRRPEEQSKASLSNSHLSPAHGGWSIQFTAGVSNGCQASPDTHNTLPRVFRRIVEYPANESQRNTQN